MLYELRFYYIHVGRMPDIHDRMRAHLPALLERHRIPVVGRWSVTAGPSVPMFIWLIAWPDADARMRGWGGFYVDPEWARVRRDTNAGSEMNEGSDVFLLNPHPAWKLDPDADALARAGGLHELIIYKVGMGQAAAASAFLSGNTLPAIKRAGGTVMGIMDVSSGSGLPAIAMFVAWSNYERRLKGWSAIEDDDERRAAIKSQRESTGHPLLGRASVYLLEPASYALPLASLGMQP